MSVCKKNILCIVAHPDDEALGVGGTLIKHVNQGDNVNIVIMSLGEDSKSNIKKNKFRKNNATEWSNLVGCKLHSLLKLPDQQFDIIPKLEIIKKIEIILNKIKPSIVYIHHSGDINHDHQIISHAVLTAMRPMGKYNFEAEIRSFETPSSTEQSPNIEQYIFRPNFYVNIEEEWKKKLLALNVYKHELGNHPHPRSIKSIEALAIKRGSESGYKKAEAFQIIRKFWNKEDKDQ